MPPPCPAAAALHCPAAAAPLLPLPQDILPASRPRRAAAAYQSPRHTRARTCPAPLLPPLQELHLYREEDLLGKFSPLK